MAAHLNVDTDGVHQAATAVSAAPAGAATPALTVTPCAADAVSVQLATRLTGQVCALNADTMAVHSRTAVAGDHLSVTAASYDDQEMEASRALAPGGRGGGVVPIAAMPTLTPPPMIAPPGLPAGPEPATGHQASTLIHGGPGASGFDTAATTLENHAVALEQAAAHVRTARSNADSSWSSSGADTADSHLHRLEMDYTSQAEAAAALARQFRSHADDYRRTKAAIPPPQVFDDLHQRLKMAVAANSTPPTLGLYAPAITTLQGQLAQANHTGLTAYQQYRAAALTPSPPKPAVSGGSSNGAGGMEHAGAGGDGADTTAATADELAGTASDTAADGAGLAGIDTVASGADPAAAGLGGDSGAELLGTVAPALLGGVTGLIGGLVGGLASATQGVQQAGTQLLGGLTQAASSAATAAAARANTPDLTGEFGAEGADLGGAGDFGSGGGGDVGDAGGLGGGGGGDEFGDVGDFGGGDYGGTTPAGMGGGAPGTFPAAAPVTAAPATFSAGAMTATGATAAAGGPGMMPPMMPMGAGGAGAGAESDRRLYPQRRLHVESPANAEPVKGRREARKTRSKSTEENTK